MRVKVVMTASLTEGVCEKVLVCCLYSFVPMTPRTAMNLNMSYRKGSGALLSPANLNAWHKSLAFYSAPENANGSFR